VTYEVVLSSQARRALSIDLPEVVAAACWEFLSGALAENPQRVGKPLRGELEGRYSSRRGEFRIIYRIVEDRIRIEVINLRHRRDAYRT
jgi:mRNA interferase RelE/StbE